MFKKLWLAAALASTVLLTPGSTTPVDAAQLAPLGAISDDTGVTDVRYRGGGGGYRGGYRGGYAVRPYIYVGPPAVAYYGYSTYSGSHCASLRRRAHETGSRYWWNRYRDEC